MKTSKFYTRATPLRTRNENILENLNIFFHLLTLCWGDNDWCVDYGVCLHRTLQCKYWSHRTFRDTGPGYLSITAAELHPSRGHSPPPPHSPAPPPACHVSRVTRHVAGHTTFKSSSWSGVHSFCSWNREMWVMAIFTVGWEDKIMQSNTRAPGCRQVTCWGHCVKVLWDGGQWMLDGGYLYREMINYNFCKDT